MNLTLSVDEKIVERARQVAQQQGTSLNALIREYLEHLAGEVSGDQILEEFERLWSKPGDSKGSYHANRDELYADRIDRRRG
jgi:hypothetical protein